MHIVTTYAWSRQYYNRPYCTWTHFHGHCAFGTSCLLVATWYNIYSSGSCYNLVCITLIRRWDGTRTMDWLSSLISFFKNCSAGLPFPQPENPYYYAAHKEHRCNSHCTYANNGTNCICKIMSYYIIFLSAASKHVNILHWQMMQLANGYVNFRPLMYITNLLSHTHNVNVKYAVEAHSCDDPTTVKLLSNYTRL